MRSAKFRMLNDSGEKGVGGSSTSLAAANGQVCHTIETTEMGIDGYRCCCHSHLVAFMVGALLPHLLLPSTALPLFPLLYSLFSSLYCCLFGSLSGLAEAANCAIGARIN